MKLTLIVNPKASAYTPKRRALVEQVLGEGHDLKVVETLYRNHAIDLAREAAAGGADRVIVLGGDGTLNEAANGLAGSSTAMGVLPGGSTNVFARTIGMKRKVKPAVAQLRDALSRPPTRIGLGLANGRYFLFHVGMGFDAAVVAKVEEKPHLKRKIGQAVFVYAAFATWFGRFDRKSPHLVVHDGGRAVVDDGYFAICLNSNPYTYLGLRRLQVAPDAGLDRPLVLVTLRTIRFGRFMPLVGSTLASGRKLQKSKLVDYRPGLREVTVSAAAGRAHFPWQADGDFLGDAQQLTFGWEPDRLLLVMP